MAKRVQLLNVCKLYRVHYYVVVFYLTLNIQVNNFSVMSAHSTKIKMRGSREGWQRVLAPSLESRKPLGLFSNTGPDPLEN